MTIGSTYYCFNKFCVSEKKLIYLFLPPGSCFVLGIAPLLFYFLLVAPRAYSIASVPRVKGNENVKLDESKCWPKAVVIEPNEPNPRPDSSRKMRTTQEEVDRTLYQVG
jgi:hypothetical protein